ncbi:MAG TPA: hypothetical protein VI146_08515 [Nitrososphaeraceae archaeon]
MRLPNNPVRKRIISGFLGWTPDSPWANNSLKDAELLVRECQKLIPYVTVMYRNLIEQDNLRKVDMRYREWLSKCCYETAFKLRDWLMQSPYLQDKERVSYTFKNIFAGPEELVKKSTAATEQPAEKIGYGYMNLYNPIIQYDFNRSTLRAHYPNLFANNSKAPTELSAFVLRWGHPNNKVTFIKQQPQSFALIFQKE